MTVHGVHAATDVTGFGLLGHLSEIARHSGRQGVTVELDWRALPLFDGVPALAAGEVLPAAASAIARLLDASMLDAGGLSTGQIGILCGPETSGGILAFLPAQAAEAFVRALHERRGSRKDHRQGRWRALRGTNSSGIWRQRKSEEQPCGGTDHGRKGSGGRRLLLWRQRDERG